MLSDQLDLDFRKFRIESHIVVAHVNMAQLSALHAVSNEYEDALVFGGRPSLAAYAATVAVILGKGLHEIIGRQVKLVVGDGVQGAGHDWAVHDERA